MRLREVAKQPVTIRTPVDDEDQYIWTGGETIRAIVQPDSSSVLVELYGEQSQRMLLLFYSGPTVLQERQGVCVNVAPDASCDYRIVSVANWNGVQRAVLDFIPEARRG